MASSSQTPFRVDPAYDVPDLADVDWIFGYGSLMWRPGFEYEQSAQAVLPGYHRAACVYSHHHRGTVAVPGLVLGLDQGGECHGTAFKLLARNKWQVVDYLNE